MISAVTAFANLFGMGGAPLCSIARGQGDLDEAERVQNTSFVLLVATGMLLTALGECFLTSILRLFGASADTLPYAAGYLRIYLAGTVFVMIALGMNYFINAQGFTRVGMMSVLIGALTNVALDPLFIFVFDMGVSGAALATIISQGISCIWVLHFLMKGNSILKLRRERMRIDFKLILPCIALGLAAFVMQSSESIISVCFNSSLLKYGGDIAVGAMTILSSVMQFAMMPLSGITQGAQPILSYNFGAKNASRVKETFKLLLKVCLCYSVLLWGIIMLFPGAFASLFTTSAELITFTEGALRIYCAVLFLFGVQIACQMTFVSIGNAKCSIIVAVLRKFILLIPLIYIMPAILADKTMAVYMAEPVADFIAVSCTAISFTIEFRKVMARLEGGKN